MEVRRVQKGEFGSTIEPPLELAWNEITKLEWQAAVTALDTGLTVSVKPGSAKFWDVIADMWISFTNVYDVRVEDSTIGSMGFQSAWDILSGISMGARAMKERKDRLKCTKCNGNGSCPMCNGSGEASRGGETFTCPACNGSGNCNLCNGSGEL